MADERDILAGEYVLGTLSAAEREGVERLRAADAALDRAIVAWEKRLHPLTAAVHPVAPPARVWAAIDAATAPHQAASAIRAPRRPVTDATVALRKRVTFWRLSTFGTGLALAASLAAVVTVGPWFQPKATTQYVAVVNAGGELPALIVNVDTRAGQVSVRSVAAAAPSGKSLELWYIGAGQRPRSMGTMGSTGSVIRASTAGFGGFAPAEVVFAVTEEPPGGSPTGQPTGPVVYSGKLIPVPE
ncbi:MAG: anti-sigma factor [Bauldia sp.]